MKIKATVSEIREVNISKIEILVVVKRALWKELCELRDVTESNPEYTNKSIREADYINAAFKWESWYDTGHGSGITTIYRAATSYEVELYNSTNNIIEILKNRLPD